ncbi:leucine-rich glioma-inactivated protein 1-like [Coturnix japonica]|uniref:leucine-rich glioma-inactivated protein 1-like n=1 Tax=Coturnix japonica TaxID=93934 RepID=UPI000776ED12|nr:leucine-rich glioma-inactivated protein 1-like [Coturnix japonica]
MLALGSRPHADYYGLHGRDLRGNPFICDCGLRWLVPFLGSSVPNVEVGICRGPPRHEGTPITQLRIRDFQCNRHELQPFQSLPFSSLSAEPFVVGGQHYGVALAQPFSGSCALLEWDQMGGRFRTHSVVNASSPVWCHPVPIADSLVLVVAQLHGTSSVWRRVGGPDGRFVLFQVIGSGLLRRPHSISSARLGGHLYIGVADSSKGGSSTLYRWGRGGFYPHQTLRPWNRDTHMEFMELGGRPALVVCSGARRPTVYRMSRGVFEPHTDIPHVPDVYMAKHYKVEGNVYLCLTRFLGDAKVMRWEGSMFREVQQLPARGSLVFQPVSISSHRYVFMGNDFGPTRVYGLDPTGRLEPKQELLTPTPRAFAPIEVGGQHFVVVASFKGATRVYRHVTVDVGT